MTGPWHECCRIWREGLVKPPEIRLAAVKQYHVGKHQDGRIRDVGYRCFVLQSEGVGLNY